MKRTAHWKIQRRQGTSAAEAQKEIENFLEALESYAARVAEQPRLSFQEHLVNICAEEARPAARVRKAREIGKPNVASGFLQPIGTRE